MRNITLYSVLLGFITSKKREMLHNWDLIKNRAERKQLSHLIINPIKHSRIHDFLKIN